MIGGAHRKRDNVFYSAWMDGRVGPPKTGPARCYSTFKTVRRAVTQLSKRSATRGPLLLNFQNGARHAAHTAHHARRAHRCYISYTLTRREYAPIPRPPTWLRPPMRSQSTMLVPLLLGLFVALVAGKSSRAPKPEPMCQAHVTCVNLLHEPAWCDDTKNCHKCEAWDDSDQSASVTGTTPDSCANMQPPPPPPPRPPPPPLRPWRRSHSTARSHHPLPPPTPWWPMPSPPPPPQHRRRNAPPPISLPTESTDEESVPQGDLPAESHQSAADVQQPAKEQQLASESPPPPPDDVSPPPPTKRRSLPLATSCVNPQCELFCKQPLAPARCHVATPSCLCSACKVCAASVPSASPAVLPAESHQSAVDVQQPAKEQQLAAESPPPPPDDVSPPPPTKRRSLPLATSCVNPQCELFCKQPLAPARCHVATPSCLCSACKVCAASVPSAPPAVFAYLSGSDLHLPEPSLSPPPPPVYRRRSMSPPSNRLASSPPPLDDPPPPPTLSPELPPWYMTHATVRRSVGRPPPPPPRLGVEVDSAFGEWKIRPAAANENHPSAMLSGSRKQPRMMPSPALPPLPPPPPSPPEPSPPPMAAWTSRQWRSSSGASDLLKSYVLKHVKAPAPGSPSGAPSLISKASSLMKHVASMVGVRVPSEGFPVRIRLLAVVIASFVACAGIALCARLCRVCRAACCASSHRTRHRRSRSRNIRKGADFDDSEEDFDDLLDEAEALNSGRRRYTRAKNPIRAHGSVLVSLDPDAESDEGYAPEAEERVIF